MSSCLVMAAIAIERGRNPDWEAARQLLASMTRASILRNWELADVTIELADCVDSVRARLAAARPLAAQSLTDVEEAWTGDRSDAGVLTFAGVNILVTGESTWGDQPELVASFDRAESIGLLSAAGFTVGDNCPKCGRPAAKGSEVP
jgi:hypothetical protein